MCVRVYPGVRLYEHILMFVCITLRTRVYNSFRTLAVPVPSLMEGDEFLEQVLYKAFTTTIAAAVYYSTNQCLVAFRDIDLHLT